MKISKLPSTIPQTSGGLFIAIAKERAEEFVRELKENKVFAWEVGSVEPPGDHHLLVE